MNKIDLSERIRRAQSLPEESDEMITVNKRESRVFDEVESEKLSRAQREIEDLKRKLDSVKSQGGYHLTAKDLTQVSVRLLPETSDLLDEFVEKSARFSKDNEVKLQYYEKVSKSRLIRFLVESFAVRIDELDYRDMVTSNDLYNSIESLFKNVPRDN